MPDRRTPVEMVKKHPGGRPLKFTFAEVQKNIDTYFLECNDTGRPYTITGLALAIGFNGRQQMDDYMVKEEFHDIIKRAKAKVENRYEEGLVANNPTGRIFALKNMGWSDKQEVDFVGSIKHSRESDLDKLSTEELKSLQLLLDKAKVE